MTLPGDFHERMQLLIDATGPGHIVPQVVVDQIYAKYQELREDLQHPGGGSAHALQQALYQQIHQIMQNWADGLLNPEGGLIEASRENAELIARHYFGNAPFEFGDLRGSTHPTVTDDGAVVYDRPPGVHRLGRDDLAAKGDLRRLGFGNAVSEDELAVGLGVG